MATAAPVQGLVAVTGPTGFIGSHVVKTLRRAGIAVPAVVHPQSKKADQLTELRALGCDIASADVGDLGALERAFNGCASVVHLVAVIRERLGATFDLINRRGAAGVAAGARTAGVGRLVHLSAPGAGPQGPRSFRSEWAGGGAIRRGGGPHVVFRSPFFVVPRRG